MKNIYDFEESKSCYLDGRYINIVLNNYPGLIRENIYLTFKDEYNWYIDLKSFVYTTDHPSVIRVIVSGENIRHSILVIIDHRKQKLIIYDPSGYSNYSKWACSKIKEFITSFLKISKTKIIKGPKIQNKNIDGCEKVGVCNAMILKYAIKYINAYIEHKELKEKNILRDEDARSIRRFMSYIEMEYKLPEGEPDIEYDWSNGQMFGTLAGGLLGATIGGAAGGAPGALVGGTLGAMGGYTMGSYLR